MANANNKGMNCCAWCSISGPLEARSVRDIESREREREGGLIIEDGLFNSSVENVISSVIVAVIFRLL
jgi:hypothetical protein